MSIKSSKKNSKKTIGLVVVLILFIALISLGVTYYFINQTTPEKVFGAYVSNGLKLKQRASYENQDGTGSKTSSKIIIDLSNKIYRTNSKLECSAKYRGDEVSVKATIQQENGKTYFRLDEITGKYKNLNGGGFDLGPSYANVVGKWYSSDADNKAISSLLNSGVMAANFSLSAPSYDTKVIQNEIIKNKVFYFNSSSKSDDTYVFKFVSDRNSYAALLKDKFSNLSNQDLVLDNIYGEKTTYNSTLTVGSDGQWIKEVASTHNNCVDLFNLYIGEEVKGIAQDVNTVAIDKKYKDVVIKPISGASPISTMKGDMTLKSL